LRTKRNDMKAKKEQKLCFAGSTGGHFEQLMMLRPLMERYESFIITEETSYAVDGGGKKIYYMKMVNRREKSFAWRMLVNIWRSAKIFFREKPDVVICTGVLATIPICLIAKLFGRKLVYIESFAKVNSPTLTGRLLYHFADRFYVQWEQMLEIYPRAIWLGGIY